MSPRSNRRGPRRRQSRRRVTRKKLWRFIRLRWREMRAFVGAVCAAHPAVASPVMALLVGVICVGGV